MSTNPQSSERISMRRIWFGLITAAWSWILLGCMDILISWRACQHQEQYGIPPPAIGPRILIGALASALVLLGVAAAVISYRNWRRLSSQKNYLHAQVADHREYLSFIGVIVSVTMTMGMVWLALPPIFLSICWRAR